VCCSVLQCGAVWCSVCPCVAVCCSVLQCVAVCCRLEKDIPRVHPGVQCVVVRCSVLQCVAVCCCLKMGVSTLGLGFNVSFHTYEEVMSHIRTQTHMNILETETRMN